MFIFFLFTSGVFWKSIHFEVASDSFSLLINSSWLLVFAIILFVHIFPYLFHHYFGLFLSYHFWCRDLLRELDKKYEVLLIIFFLLFGGVLVSEALLFVSFFWTSFNSLSSITLGIISHEAFYLPDPCELTFTNTLLLSNAAISLGITFTSLEISSHFYISYSFTLCSLFISLQGKEFRILALLINDSLYSCLFFTITGLHFFHLVYGLLLLSLLFWSCSFSYLFFNLIFMKLYFVLLIKSHLLSYPCPIIINYLWNIGFLLGITIILQIITGIFLGLHYTSDLNSAYFSIFQIIREIYYGWCLRYLHSSGASFVFLFIFLHLARALFYVSYFYNTNIWFSGILLFFFLMGIAFIGYVLPFGQMSFWDATVITNLLSPFPSLIEFVCGGYYVLHIVPDSGNSGDLIFVLRP